MAICIAWPQPSFAGEDGWQSPVEEGAGLGPGSLSPRKGLELGLVWMLCPPSGSPAGGARGERRELSLLALHVVIAQ